MSEHDVIDAIIIGAGFSGMRTLHELRQLGRSARILEAGSDVGGTWYWNRYPGARTDSESWVFCFSFDDDLLQDWDWHARFPAQPDVLHYLQHVADRFDMRKDITFDTRVTAAAFDEERDLWVVTTDTGEQYVARYLVAATGFLSVAYEPPFEGLHDFEGEWHLTARYPGDADLTGKRVAVIGTGATGIQVIPEVAQSAGHLTVFQRTAQYAIPNRNHPLEAPQRNAIKARYDEIWDQCRKQVFAFPIERPHRNFADVDAAEQQRIFEAGWETGGFRFIFETFEDVVANPEANAAACEFVRNKIRTIVKDPGTAELLCPYDHPIGAKRVPLCHHYYETFNRDDVSLVSVRDNPIERLTPKGILLADGTEHEVDVIIFALGFDAGTGALTSIDVRGREDRVLAEDWAHGPRSNMGLTAHGYPNMFMLFGPHTPLTNAPVLIDEQAKWLGRAIAHTEERGHTRMEATTASEDAFAERLQSALDATLLGDAAEVRSYYLGANIPGKEHSILVYLAGAAKYFREIAATADGGFDGYQFSGSRPEVGVGG